LAQGRYAEVEPLYKRARDPPGMGFGMGHVAAPAQLQHGNPRRNGDDAHKARASDY
jgi:hypothetical protein